MDVALSGVKDAEAVQLIHGLRQALIAQGVPLTALSLKRPSSEQMGIGSILGVDVYAIFQLLGAAGYIALFSHCLLEMNRKPRVQVHLMIKDGWIDLPHKTVSPKEIERILEEALADLRKDKAK